MGFVQEVFRSTVFNYVYIFGLGLDERRVINEVYELSEVVLSAWEFAEKKRMISEAYGKPVVSVRKEHLKRTL